MIVAELKKRLEPFPDDMEVVVASPDFLPFSRVVDKVGGHPGAKLPITRHLKD